MQRLIIAALSLGLSLSGATGIALAQDLPVTGLVTNADGANVRSTAGVNPTANGEGGTIIYGDITTGPGFYIIGPPEVTNTPTTPSTSTAPAGAAPAAGSDAVDTTAAPSVNPGDLDGDNYPDAQEPALGLDPNSADTDVDGIADGDEINIYGTDPLSVDTDGDGISDGAELFDTRTDPLVWDGTEGQAPAGTVQQVSSDQTTQPSSVDSTDLAQNISVPEKEAAYLRQQGTTEILTAIDGNASALGTGDATASPGTVTRNGVTVPSILGPDGTYSVNEVSPPTVNVPANTEVSVAPAPDPASEPEPVVEAAPEPAPVETAAVEGESTEAVASEPVATEPVAAEPAAAETSVDSTDLDGDNYPDALEVEMGLDPNNIDTDGDGVADGDEINIYGTDPFTADSDGDGVNDGSELYDTRTDPLAWTDFAAETSAETVETGAVVEEGM